MTTTVADPASKSGTQQPHVAKATVETGDWSVIVVGAGFGGLGIARELKKAGIPFLVVEENPHVGGVWWDNRYPGASCDVPSHLYSFAFDPYRDATTRYPDQRAILHYLCEIVDRHGLRPHLRLNTAITAATYSNDGRWTITTDRGETLRADNVVWAVGQLHRPHIPTIPGQDQFAGAAFHSARWDHSVEWAGRDVAVIGTGSSGAQIVGAVARDARRVTVYQRTPAWILPKPAACFGPITRWTLAHLPAAHALYRTAIQYGADAVLAPVMTGGWSARPVQWAAKAHLWWRIRDPQLRAQLTPGYAIGEKRILIDSTFYPALRQPHVQLVTDQIDCLTGDGIRASDGTHRRHDVIVYATGFKATEFLKPITVRGRDGIDLHQQWSDGAEAYLGLAVPGFPSMWLIAGPHSFTASNSNPTMKQFATRYILRGIQLRSQLGTPIEVSAHAMRRYRTWLETAMARTVWPKGVPSWFKTEAGRVTNPWPATARAYDRMTCTDPAEVFVSVPTSRMPPASTAGSRPASVA
ncbi:NAD(P)/FAD-dependent oxidoreductase [Nocardia abscessus]|uniref:NAD(P)/FAD-dependent oxidoreductase n=1 Tax=Nocardia abscessus TaxID=120957 RepID=A0ABS0CHB4_9NOCA|nr:NAD(P)/FAD-dependent oxidoreductase [Nocardia abscessus]MBF6229280.1 NAD(P)/FAD-dependent oxidoreductase [Nocardia abscessus]